MSPESLYTFFAELTGKPGTTDFTLCSDGSVCVRRNGRLSTSRMDGLVAYWPALVSGLGLCAGKAITRGCQEGARYRMLLTTQLRGQSLAVRPIPPNIPSEDSLGLPTGLVRRFCALRGGLVLVAGQSGAGKSTTIAALLAARLRESGGKLITLEEPVEYLFPCSSHAYVEQRELGRDVETYELGLRQALQMNPDLILVQEVRSSAAAETVLAAALSGHLVVATIHAHDACAVVQRFTGLLSGQGLTESRESLALSLELVLVQRLLPSPNGLKPIFEVLPFRDGKGRIRAVEAQVRSGDWAALRQEMEMGARYGMQLFDKVPEITRRETL